ncbi:MAG: response regulator transcription factor [Verrucomicrobia bacterium]|nr:response regulator transcription factor [Verrucomicrobiota bacterium]
MHVAVIEDQTLVRDYLAGLLRRHFSVTTLTAVGSMAELKSQETELRRADLVLLDIELGDGSTLDWAVQRAQSGGRGAIVALSSIKAAFPFKRLQAAGISLVHKGDGEAELVAVIRHAIAGRMVFSRGVMEIIQAAGRDPLAPTKLLSPKEIQVLALLGQRFSNAEIAEFTGSALATIADHRKRIMRKLDLHSAEELIDYAIRHGVVHDSTAAAAHHQRRR